MYPVLVAAKLKVGSIILAPFILQSAFLPDRATLGPGVTIPQAISKLHPLPEEELFTSYNRGNSYLISGKFNEALIEFNRALDIRQDVVDLWLSRGIANEKLLRWDDAVDDYKEAIRLNKQKLFSKDAPEAFSNLANAEAGQGKWDIALKDFTYAASLNPDYIAPQLGRALCLFQLGRKEESLAYFDSLSAKYPRFADGRAAQAIIRFDVAYQGLQDKKSAGGGEGQGGGVGGEREKEDSLRRSVLDAWEVAIQEDSRYTDVDWVQNIRRWPPSLVNALVEFKKWK